MEEAKWPLLVRMSVRDIHRIDLSVYEDNEITRRYIGACVAEGNIEPAAAYAQLSERVLVDDLAFAANYVSSLPPNDSD